MIDCSAANAVIHPYKSTVGMGQELTYANDRELAANLASDTGSMEFKFPSAPRVPKHLRLQSQGTEQYFPVWSAQEQLHSVNVLGTEINKRSFGAADRVGAIGRWIQTNFFNPRIQYSRVLPGSQVRRLMNSTGKQKVVIYQLRFLDPSCNGIPGWRSNFKLNRSRGFLLHDDRPWGNAITVANVPYPQAH